MHVIAAKAVAYGEALRPDFVDYQKRVIENAKAMSARFMELGYGLVSGGTDNHLMLIDLRSKGVTGKEAEEALGRAEITVNKNMVPFDTQSPFVTSGIRVGTPALTTRGFTKEAFVAVADLINRVIEQPTNESVIESVKADVHDLCAQFPLYRTV
jgi:glycine hydroxymethyltransferase